MQIVSIKSPNTSISCQTHQYLAKLFKGTPTSFEGAQEKPQNFEDNEIEVELPHTISKTKDFGQIPKFQTMWPYLHRFGQSLQKEKGCKVRGGGGLIYSSKASSPLKVPKN